MVQFLARIQAFVSSFSVIQNDRVKHTVKVALIPFGLVIGMVVTVYAVALLFEPNSQPQNIFISNITDTQVTISWTTKKATRGAIKVIEQGESFPTLPLFTFLHKDDGEKTTNRTRYYTTHHVTVLNLEPEKQYRFAIYQGFKKVYQGTFSTTKTAAALSSPYPIYGKIIDFDTRKPLVGAIVYFQAELGGAKSSLLSTITNKEGRWTIERSNLRTEDGLDVFQVSRDTLERIVVDAGKKGRGKSESRSGSDRPWPDVLVQIEK